MNHTVNYQMLSESVKALTESIPYETANLANVSALLWQELPGINWVGFYKITDGQLVLGPFQGKVACVLIPVGRGVCGTAVAEDRTQLVYDVHQFPGHIACDCASNSEIVVRAKKIIVNLKERFQTTERFLEVPRRQKLL